MVVRIVKGILALAILLSFLGLTAVPFLFDGGRFKSFKICVFLIVSLGVVCLVAWLSYGVVDRVEGAYRG